MKKIFLVITLILTINCGIPFFFRDYYLTNAYLSYYPNGTHADLIWGALNCLMYDSYNESSYFFICRKEITNPITDFFSDILQAQDDYDSNYYKQREHYWDPYLKRGLYGDIGAPYHAQDYFDKAVKYYLGLGIYPIDKHQAFYALGHAIHLLQDVTVPHHAQLDPFNKHSTYEFFCDQEIKDENIALPLHGEYSTPRDWHGNINVIGWVHEAAVTAAPFYKIIENNNYNYDLWLSIATELMGKAVKLTAGFLFYFWQYVHNIDYDQDGLDAITEQMHNADNTLIDSDFDTIHDFEEITIGEDGFITSPGTNDTDSDWLTDPQEINIYLTHPSLNDTDLDGFHDGEEIEAGTDPLDINDHPPYETTPDNTNSTPTIPSKIVFTIPIIGIVMLVAIVILVKKNKV